MRDNTKSAAAVQLFRDRFAGKPYDIREVRDVITRETGITKSHFYHVHNSHMLPIQRAAMGNSSSRRGLASDGMRIRGQVKAGVVEYFREHFAGKVGRVEECYKELQKATGVKIQYIYTLKPKLVEVHREALAGRAVERQPASVNGRGPYPAPAPVEDEVKLGVPEESEEPLSLTIPEGLSDDDKRQLGRLLTSYHAMLLEASEQRLELKALQRELVVQTKKTALLKKLIHETLEAL